MAQDELISQYIDKSAITADTDFLIAELGRAKDSYDKLAASKIGISTSQSLPDLSANVRQATKDTQDYIKTQTLLINTQRQQVQLENDLLKQAALKAKADADALKTEAAKQKASQQTGAQKAKEAKDTADLSNDYKQLSLAYNDAALKAKNLQIVLGQNHPIAVQATADAKAQGDYLKSLDASTGSYTRNVGNYSSAFQGYALTLRGLRGPTKLLGEALGIGAQEADQLRLVLEHSLQAIAAIFKSREEKAAATELDTAATQANTEATLANNAAQEAGAAIPQRASAAQQTPAITEAGAGVADVAALTEASAAATQANVSATEELSAAKIELATAEAASAAAAEAELVAETELNVITLTNLDVTTAEIAAMEALAIVQATAAAAATAEFEAQVRVTLASEASIVATEAQAVAQTQLAAATAATTAATSAFFSSILKATGIGLIIGVIAALVYKIIEYRKAVADAAATQKIFNEVNEDAAKAAGKEVGSLIVLRGEIENVLIPMDKRLQAVKNLKDEFPDLLKNVSDEALLNGQAAASYDLVTASIVRKAKAQASESKIQDLISKNQDLQIKGSQEAEKVKNEIANAKDDQEITSGGSGGANGNFGGVSAVAKQKKYLEDFKQFSTDTAAAIRKNNEVIALLLPDAAVSENIQVDKPKKEKSNENLASTKDLLDEDFELYKINQQRKIKLLDDQVNDEKLSFDKRLDALNAFSTASLELIDRTAKSEINKLDAKEQILKANSVKQKGTELNNTLAEISEIEKQKTILQAKFDSDRLTVFDNNEKKFNVIAGERAKEYLKIQKSKFDKALQLISDHANNEKALNDKQYNEGLDGLQARLDAGEISQREFNKKKLDLDFAYAVASLAIEEDRIKKIIAIDALEGVDVTKQLQALALLEKQIRDASVDHTLKTEKAKRDAIVSTLNTIKDVGDKVFGVIDGLANANLTAQKNALTAQQNADEDKAARDIDIVNASVASEEDKAAKIAIINARLQAQKDQIAQREKQAEETKAKFDKAASIFNIILSTAVAVVKALPNIPLSIAIGALGAAELGIAIATPIPKYKHGKGAGNNYEGLAIVGDGGRKEVIEHSDGSFHVTPAVDTLTHIKSSDIVHPDFNAWRDALLNAAYRDANNAMQMPAHRGHDNSTNKLLSEQNKLLKEIANKPGDTTRGTDKGMVKLMQWGSKQIKYTDQNTNW